MRIFTAVRHSLDPRQYFGGLWSQNFYPALRRLGHEVIESEVDLLPASRFMHEPGPFTPQESEVRDQITSQIIDEIKRAHRQQPVDVFLSYFYNAHFNPAAFDELHRLGIRTINFYCNSIYQFELVDAIAAKVQTSWHAEHDARRHYIAAGARPVWVQMGADPDLYFPVLHVERLQRACFIGQRYADRDRLVAALLSADVPLDLYGTGWGAAQAPVPENKSAQDATGYLGRPIASPGSLSSYCRLVHRNIRRQGVLSGARRTALQARYRRASRRLSPIVASAAQGFAPDINVTMGRYELLLNFSNVWADGNPGSKLIPHVRLRDFEGPMAGACYLTGYVQELEEFYELGKEVDVYRSPEELVDKARFYLRHPTQAQALREAGYRRARRDHTWDRRFQQLLTLAC